MSGIPASFERRLFERVPGRKRKLGVPSEGVCVGAKIKGQFISGVREVLDFAEKFADLPQDPVTPPTRAFKFQPPSDIVHARFQCFLSIHRVYQTCPRVGGSYARCAREGENPITISCVYVQRKQSLSHRSNNRPHFVRWPGPEALVVSVAIEASPTTGSGAQVLTASERTTLYQQVWVHGHSGSHPGAPLRLTAMASPGRSRNKDSSSHLSVEPWSCQAAALECIFRTVGPSRPSRTLRETSMQFGPSDPLVGKGLLRTL